MTETDTSFRKRSGAKQYFLLSPQSSALSPFLSTRTLTPIFPRTMAKCNGPVLKTALVTKM
jgi:hypothetical protein